MPATSRPWLWFSSLISLWGLGAAGLGKGRGQVKEIAIIGAGAAGSSTAYHLRKYAEQEGLEVNIHIFERSDHIGGRSLTVNAYGDAWQPVELGASIFVDVNHILVNATREFNLQVIDPGSDEAGLLGIWDGVRFVFQQDSESSAWWDLVKLVWKYGTAPYYTRNLVHETVATFLKMYGEPYFPFRSLTATAYELGLHKITGLTGRQFLEEKKLYGPFAQQIVQTATRVNYASNLDYIHGLGTMVSMAAEGSMAVLGGNWQIFAHMVGYSRAQLHLNTTVVGFAAASAPGYTKYVMRVKDSDTPADDNGRSYTKGGDDDHEFDAVVIATPYQYSGLKLEDDTRFQEPDEIPYATLHVTLFATPFRFSPSFFNLDPGSKVPISVLTTLGADEKAGSGADGAGRAGFYSATLVKTVLNPKTQQRESVFKIFSPEKVTPEFLSSLLGVRVPDGFTRPTDAETRNEFDVVEPISWYYPWVVHPYPQKHPRVTFQDPILREGLYYTSGMESFISTMETSALAGMNVARLIADDHLDLSDAGEKMQGPLSDNNKENSQQILVELFGKESDRGDPYGQGKGNSTMVVESDESHKALEATHAVEL